MKTKTLLDTTITTAVTGALSELTWAPGDTLSALFQGAMVYVASAATSIDAWIQTSVDGGVTWIDVVNFRWTTSSAVKACNLSGLTAVTTQFTPTDGTLSANTCRDGVLGTLYRVKYTSVGTYGAGTTLKIVASFKQSIHVD
jgi:hypothetical protein